NTTSTRQGMSETKDITDKTLRSGSGARKPLTLNRTVESGHVQQKFSHGRSKSVEVIKKRKRTLTGAEAEEATPAPTAPAKVAPPGAGAAPTRAPPAPGPPQPAASQPQQRMLSEREQAARASALVAERRAQEAAETERLRREAEQIEHG